MSAVYPQQELVRMILLHMFPQSCPICHDFQTDFADRMPIRENWGSISSPWPYGFSLGTKTTTVAEEDPRKTAFVRLSTWTTGRASRDKEEETNDETYELNVPLLYLEQQASRGCSGCSMLLEAFQRSWKMNVIFSAVSKAGNTYGSPEKRDLTVEMASKNLWLHASFEAGKSVHVQINSQMSSEQSVSTMAYDEFQLFRTSDNTHPWHIIGYLPGFENYVLNDAYKSLIGSWIRQCIEEHPSCGAASTSGTMPTRLVNVGQGEHDILLEEVSEVLPYVALSHCWKYSQPFCFTRKTLRDSGATIPWDQLSATLRDAIKVTRWLGIKYLWIDSICIFQQDEEDWQQEAPRMGDIYRGAYITIAAHLDPNRPSATHGCHLYRHNFQELSCLARGGKRFSTFMRGGIDHAPIDKMYANNEPESLAKRGWCFQERILSSRILHFCPTEVVFECLRGGRCECGHELLRKVRYRPEALQHSRKANLMGKIISSYTDGTNINGDVPELDSGGDEVRRLWNMVLKEYTNTVLTYPKDTLPALSSAAKRMPAGVLGNYHAGLWTKDLIRGLLWKPRTQCRHRHQGYIAPSYSWASGYGPVEPYFAVTDHAMEAKIIEAEVEPASQDPTSLVKNGHLRIHGRVATVKLELSVVQRTAWALTMVPWVKHALQKPLAESCEILLYTSTAWFCRFAGRLPFLSWFSSYRKCIDHFWYWQKFHASRLPNQDAVVKVTRLGAQNLDFPIYIHHEYNHLYPEPTPSEEMNPGRYSGKWSGRAFADTVDDLCSLAMGDLLALEIANESPTLGTEQRANGSRYPPSMTTTALLLVPSKSVHGAFQRVGLLEFTKSALAYPETEAQRRGEIKQEDLITTNDCFEGFDKRDILLV